MSVKNALLDYTSHIFATIRVLRPFFFWEVQHHVLKKKHHHLSFGHILPAFHHRWCLTGIQRR